MTLYATCAIVAYMILDSDVVAELQRIIKRNGLRPTAREFGYSAPYVGDVSKGRRRLTDSMADKLGFVLYEDPPKPSRVWGKK